MTASTPSLGAQRGDRPRPTILAGIAVVALGSGALAVGGLADAAGEHDGISRIDPRVARDVLSLRDGPLTALAHLLTFLGSEAVVGVLAVVLMLVLLRRRWYVEAVTLGVGMAGSAALTVGVKHVVARVRPPTIDRLGSLDTGYSFPSGHSLNSAVFLGLVVLLLAGSLPRGRRRLLAVAAVVLAAGVGLSRIYLGYHWTTDVLGAWSIATAWLITLAALLPLLRRHLPPLLDRYLPESVR